MTTTNIDINKLTVSEAQIALASGTLNNVVRVVRIFDVFDFVLIVTAFYVGFPATKNAGCSICRADIEFAGRAVCD